MNAIVIKTENLSKYYRLGLINNGTLFRDLQTWWAIKRGKQDPHSRIDENRYDPTKEGFWALKNLSFEIKQGERVGIIGKNGAGKSTLLKILSRITAPTQGRVKIKGRIASLLEVGTGFHGELTGRENIYLNGAILGMKRNEVDRKIDEIIAFSEIEQHIDTPVKRYSSGMYVRLAFAVAAHLDSEILIADEVLAVGDASFQKKALGKMNELSTSEGRTVLFVSHNMAAVKSLCNRGMVLDKGKIVYQSHNIHSAIINYLNPDKQTVQSGIWTEDASLANTYFYPYKMLLVKNFTETTDTLFRTDKNIFIIIEAEITELSTILNLGLFLKTETGDIVFSTWLRDTNISPKQGLNLIKVKIPIELLNNGNYYFDLYAGLHNIADVLPFHSCIVRFSINGAISTSFGEDNREGILVPYIPWIIE